MSLDLLSRENPFSDVGTPFKGLGEKFPRISPHGLQILHSS